jgi:hypothetical protein
MFPESRISSLLAARENGLGLIFYESRTASLPARIREIFSLGTEGPEALGYFDTVSARNAEHFITWHKVYGEEHRSDSPVAYSKVGVDRPEGNYMSSEDGHSLMLLSRGRPDGEWSSGGRGLPLPGGTSPSCDAGRAVLFPFSIDLFAMEKLGHACGLDDIFYRSILWTARKPFFTWTMPNAAGLVVDDCSGSYDHFGYLDILNDHGWSPYLSLFTDTIDEVAHEELGLDGRRLEQGYAESSLEIGFHALRYNESFCFNHLERRPLTGLELEDRFARWDRCLSKWKVRHSPWMHPHFGEIGRNSIPYYLDRGIEFVTWLLPLDAAWFDVPATIPPMSPQPPYGHNGYYITELPGFPGLAAFNCVLDRKTRTSADYVVKTDFLWGNTPFWNESETVDIDAASSTLADQIKRGLDSGFYGEGATHEQRFACLRKGEIREIFEEADRLLARHHPQRRRLGEIMAIAKKRSRCRLIETSVNAEGGRLHYAFSSDEAVGTEFQIHTQGPEGRIYTSRHTVSCRQSFVDAPGQAGN